MREYTHEFADHWFYTPTPLEKSGGLWPIRAGRNRAKPHYKIGPRMITYYSLHMVLDGKGGFMEEGQHYDINQGDLFCLLPNQLHHYYSDRDQPLKMFWLAFDGKQGALLLNRIGVTHYSPFVKGLIDDTVIEVLEELARQFEIEADNELTRLSIIFQLFNRLSLNAKQKNLTSVTPTNWVEKSKEYMDIHFAEDISVKDVAEYIGIHRSHLSTTFANKIGMTPVQYLLSLKMEKAAQLIMEQSYTITEIALSLGYSDLYSFSRAFKKYHGVSPKQYTPSLM